MKRTPRPDSSAKVAPRPSSRPGQFHRPLHITFLGAGSQFTPRLVSDLLHMGGAERVKIALVDIDDARLQSMVKIIRKLIALHGREQWTVLASTDRAKLLPDSNYIINCIEVNGLDCVQHDYQIPLKYGVDQCIGDTVGPGGVFKALRTIPVWLEILADAERLCPDAMVLNYTNPMSMMCLAAVQASKLPVVGLCHSVQSTSELLARRAGVPYGEMAWDCAGINHLAWFTKLEHQGKSLYPALVSKAKGDLSGSPVDPKDAGDLVRKDLMVRFGAFPTESSGHVSEYVPFYRKRKDLRDRYCGPGYDGESGFYAREWPNWRKQADQDRVRMMTEDAALKWKRSHEYAADIIEAREKDVPGRVYATVPNSVQGAYSLITNLPMAGVVEVACRVDRTGVRPVRFGNLPKPLAALCDANMNVIEMGVRAAMERSKEAAIQALMLDPLTAAVCSPAEISDMTLELFEAEKAYLAGYR